MTPLVVKICSNLLQHFASDVSPDLCIEPASFQDLSGVDQHSVSLTIKIVCFYSWRSSSLNKIGCSTKKAMTISALNRYAFFSPSTNKKNVFWVSKNHIQWGKSPKIFTNAYGQAGGDWIDFSDASIPDICLFFSTSTIFGSIFLHTKERKSQQNRFRDKTA